MKTIAVLITDLFEDSEYLHPTAAFTDAGHKVVTVGITEGASVRGKTENTVVEITRAVADAAIKEFDAMLIPGGYSPDKLRIDADAVRFVREFARSGKPVFTICHGPQLLITARVLKGRTVTGYKSIIQDIKNAGATYADAAVVEDGNIISSRDPGDLPEFIQACLEKLRGP